MRFLLKIPIIRWPVRRRRIAALHAEQQAYRRELAQHSDALARILAQASNMPDPCRRIRR